MYFQQVKEIVRRQVNRAVAAILFDLISIHKMSQQWSAQNIHSGFLTV